MTLVAGVDFGTESVRVAIVDHELGVVGAATAGYPVVRVAGDADHATQAHADHMQALVAAMGAARAAAGVDGHHIKALAADTTGSTVVVVDEHLEPLGDYYLWCDHRARDEARRITEVARERRLPAIELCGGTYSSEWGFAKLLHWLRHNPSQRHRAAAVLEHCDMVAATLCGIADPGALPRSLCAMGHKWMYSQANGGLPPDAFLRDVDPLLDGAGTLLAGRYGTSEQLAGRLSGEWASRLGLAEGTPVPIGALDAHWDAVGSGIAPGDVVNVVGSSSCTMAVVERAPVIPGVSGVVPGSIHPRLVGIEAGLAAVGLTFDAIARRAGRSVDDLSREVEAHRPGQTGLLRMVWDAGDRTVLANPLVSGVTFGWNLGTSAADELFAAIEGTAFHTRIVLERLAEYGVPCRRLIHGGGIPQRAPRLNQVFADAIGVPVLVPERPVTSLGSAIFAFLAAGVFQTVEEAQRALCPPYRSFDPDPAAADVYGLLYALFRRLYFALGDPASSATAVGDILPALIAIRARAMGTGVLG